MTSLSDFPHPDLIQAGVKQATQGNRHQFYSGACYLLYASAVAMQGASGLTVKFFTNEDPDEDDGDELKAILAAPDERKDAPDLYFPHGLYIEVEGVGGNSDVALVEANWVPRDAYCRAFPRVTETLQECWKNAPGRGGSALHSNFDEGDPDDGEWDNEGAAGSGGVSGATKAIIDTNDPTVNDDEGDGYSKGDVWVNTTDDSVFILADSTVGAAVWTEIGAGGGGTSTSDYCTSIRIGVGPVAFATEETIDICLPRNGTITAAHFSSTDTITANATGYWVFKLYRGADTVATFSTASTTLTEDVMTSFGTLSNTAFDGTQTLTIGIQTFSDGTQPTSINGDYLSLHFKFDND